MSAFHPVNETKLEILAVMEELDRPVLVDELWEIWEGRKHLTVFEYHLSTLVLAGVAELVCSGPELSFVLREGAA